jgi:hypothetical protein
MRKKLVKTDRKKQKKLTNSDVYKKIESILDRMIKIERAITCPLLIITDEKGKPIERTVEL